MNATCHPARPRLARGLCASCYHAQHRRLSTNRLDEGPRTTCAPCGRLVSEADLAHSTAFLCGACGRRQ